MIQFFSYIVKNPEKEKNDDDEEDEDESDKNSDNSSSRSRSRSNSSSRSRSNKKRKNKSRSNTKSPSPKSSKNVLFITSFGAEEDDDVNKQESETSSKMSSINKFLPNKPNLNENPAINTMLSQSLNLKLLKKNATDSRRSSMSPPYRMVTPNKDASSSNFDTFKKS